ncbi:MAG: hypothetical protein LIP09_04010 [Bacteroidales bacterium]|nr:hypothetical protein [Bacteroidales bacterium]
MIKIWTISTFRKSIEELLKVKRGVYAGVEDEIKKSFSNKGHQEILNTREMVLLQDDMVVIKLRMPDSRHHLSRSDGYRLLYLTYQNSPKVVLLDIYPKNGPKQLLNLTTSEITARVLTYIEENLTGNLQSFEVD